MRGQFPGWLLDPHPDLYHSIHLRAFSERFLGCFENLTHDFLGTHVVNRTSGDYHAFVTRALESDYLLRIRARMSFIYRATMGDQTCGRVSILSSINALEKVFAFVLPEDQNSGCIVYCWPHGSDLMVGLPRLVMKVGL